MAASPTVQACFVGPTRPPTLGPLAPCFACGGNALRDVASRAPDRLSLPAMIETDERSAAVTAGRGMPSALWRFGQDRRFDMLVRWVKLDGAHALDLGCGLGAYTKRMAAAGAFAVGTEVEWDRAFDARRDGVNVAAAVGELLPFPAATFDCVLLHEVLEHVADDRSTLVETARVLKPGGRAVVFVPNRGWPFETHGIMWRGTYHFGNVPLVNWLPDGLRNRLAPHVRVYTSRRIRELVQGLPLDIVHHSRVFPGFDKLAARRPRLGAALRASTYVLEGTPADRFGLSHLVVFERRR